MSRLYLITGFLGAGKTTFIKKLLEEAIEKNPDAILFSHSLRNGCILL